MTNKKGLVWQCHPTMALHGGSDLTDPVHSAACLWLSCLLMDQLDSDGIQMDSDGIQMDSDGYV